MAVIGKTLSRVGEVLRVSIRDNICHTMEDVLLSEMPKVIERIIDQTITETMKNLSIKLIEHSDGTQSIQLNFKEANNA